MAEKLDAHVGAYEGKNLYDFDNEILLTWYPKRIIELNPNAKSILELGLGHGFSTHIFSGTFVRHVVLDGSRAVIDNFKERFPENKAEIVETYFEVFESDEKFDLIVLGFILEHVDNPKVILEKYRDFLAPGGKIYVSVPNAEVLNRKLGNIAGVLPDLQALSDNDILLGHQRYYTVESLTDDINESGYEVAKMEGIYLKPFKTSQMIQLNLGKNIIDALCTVGIDYPELSCGLLAELKEN